MGLKGTGTTGVEEEDVEVVLDDLRSRGSRFALEHVVPEELRPWLLNISWDVGKLWALKLPGRDVELSCLRWHFELPWWRGADRAWFQVRPARVLDHPGQYPEHQARLVRASLDMPIHVLRRHGRWLVIDGIHRAAKAAQEGRLALPAWVLSPRHLPMIALFVVNNRALLSATVAELRRAGLDVWVFGGWAKELLGQCPSRLHGDVDLVLRADNFLPFDQFLSRSPYVEVAEKRSSHKRAYMRNGILVEVFIASPAIGACAQTMFWDSERFEWPIGTFGPSHGDLPVISAHALAAYETAHGRLQRSSPFHRTSAPAEVL